MFGSGVDSHMCDSDTDTGNCICSTITNDTMQQQRELYGSAGAFEQQRQRSGTLLRVTEDWCLGWTGRGQVWIQTQRESSAAGVMSWP